MMCVICVLFFFWRGKVCDVINCEVSSLKLGMWQEVKILPQKLVHL